MVTCILPTYNRRSFLPKAIGYFLRQDYPERELVIVDDGSDNVQDLVPDDPRIRYFRLDSRHSVGAKRNIACHHAAGDIVLHWDDDDWAADWRVSYQVAELRRSGAQICGLDRILYYQPTRNLAWEYNYPPNPRKPWVAGNTLCYRKSFWHRHPFPEINIGEDALFVWRASAREVLRLENRNFIVAMIHEANVSPKATAGHCWRSCSPAEVHELVRPAAAVESLASRRALVCAARGIGDILRVTPLVAVLHQLGFAVDLMLQPDFAAVCDLLRTRPEVHRIFLPGDATKGEYELAVFTTWSAGTASSVNSRRKMIFNQAEWLREGDTHCIARMAEQLGWRAELPLPFAAHSGRRFALKPGTVVLHPGCKPDWPWKKWHGFDELARLLPEVAIIGTESDLRNHNTYFAREFQWPGHVQNFVGKLDLADTAALISQCAALVSNDSGMMHLGVALGIPTLGIFGITSPRREIMRAPNMTVVTKGLPCEPACRTKAFGRRDCERHLECLKTLTAQEVLDWLPKTATGNLPDRTGREPIEHPITIHYHGHVFDATGYGQAARAYIHALHAAGIELSVTDLSPHARQVSDPLVESLVGKNTVREDFHLFHGVPSVWAKQALRVPNAIGMTVWETDIMPAQWRTPLNHVIEVWMPCEFNTSVFQSRLSTPVFKLPHPSISLRTASEQTAPRFRAPPEDFVFYSIFEWQDRKFPLGQLRAYFKAFPEDGPHVFIVKTNPGALKAANSALEEAKCLTGSKARTQIHCEVWSEHEVDLLHRRGDCYLSLHRGEGWCYPLFEAACRGTPVVATGYSGPLEYLGAEGHQLVAYKLTNVRQRYGFYNSAMQWAEPDVDDAANRLRWVYENRDSARVSARSLAVHIGQRYSPEAIGAAARTRLEILLRRTNKATATPVSASVLAPPVPVPGDWYDADYFENGVKSNWKEGYRWKSFQPLFEGMAAFLTTMFPAASSYFDAGCAKGFLVKALRAQRKEAWGFDCSSWAIRHAVAGTELFVQLAGADSVEPGRTFDMTVAFDLMSQLTEQQAFEFLKRARTWTSAGMLATISLSQARTNRDLSHVSLHGRDWWHDLFLRAGWRQDPLHAALENACRRHTLPTKMGWEVFLYAPS